MHDTMNANPLSEVLLNLLDTDPKEAIIQARELEEDENSLHLKCALLIDGGSAVGDREAIGEGVNIAKELRDKYQNNYYIEYNLANGFSALANTTDVTRPDWYLATHELRLDARQLWNNVAKSGKDDPEIASQAYTNLGNALSKSYRWVEAFDAYNDALSLDPVNGVAAAGAAEILKYCLEHGIGEPDILKRSINAYSEIVRGSEETILKYAGKRALESIASSLSFHETTATESEPLRGYEAFVSKHRLALSLTVGGASFSNKRWDDIAIDSVMVDGQETFQVPPIFAMFNILKSDYMLARWLTYSALNESIPDSGHYADTLDFANYGTKYSMLTVAQKSAIDVLDKLAVASLEYLNIGGAKNTDFKNAWFKKSENESFEWKDKIKEAIHAGNPALIALMELSSDFSNKNGFLKSISSLRNASTHRFVVLHDMGDIKETAQQVIEHYDINDFVRSLIETLRVVRSALLYFVEMIAYTEDIKHRNSKGLVGHLEVPSHHYIRGSDDCAE